MTEQYVLIAIKFESKIVHIYAMQMYLSALCIIIIKNINTDNYFANCRWNDGLLLFSTAVNYRLFIKQSLLKSLHDTYMFIIWQNWDVPLYIKNFVYFIWNIYL